MPIDPDAPPVSSRSSNGGAFVDHVGPLYTREHDGAIGVRIEEHHLNVAGTAMGGFLATLVDVAFGRAVRAEADDGPAVATVSLLDLAVAARHGCLS